MTLITSYDCHSHVGAPRHSMRHQFSNLGPMWREDKPVGFEDCVDLVPLEEVPEIIEG